MAYIDQNLMTGERIIYRAKLHWIVFLLPDAPFEFRKKVQEKIEAVQELS